MNRLPPSRRPRRAALVVLVATAALCACGKDGPAPAPDAGEQDTPVSQQDTPTSGAADTDTPGPSSCSSDTDCDDGVPCNGQEQCDGGTCLPGEAVSCAALDAPCTEGVCDTDTGECLAVGRPDGTACDDALICTDGDACQDGACAGAPLSCDDDKTCSVDSCDEATGGCVHDMSGCPCVEDAECDDGNACNGQETCATALATCTAGDPVDCTDLDGPCTLGTCDPTTAACEATPVVAGSPCDDDKVCTESDSCQEGACVGVTVSCDDDKTCSVDSCDEAAGGCVFDTSPCPCAVDTDCDDGNVCNGDELCDTASQTCEPGDALACDDGLFCNGAESCDPALGCESGAPPELDDEDACTLDVCDEAGGVVTHEPDPACDTLAECPEGPGVYCGAALGLEPDTLYWCTDGDVTPLETCAGGCNALPLGTDDVCAPAECPYGAGAYCGSGIGLDPDTLYYCEAGAYTVTHVCGGGCEVSPDGTADACATSSCPFSSGYYCGDPVGLDPDTLYWCVDGNYEATQICPAGCETQPPGVWDTCVELSCPFGDGLYCGAAEGQDPSALYHCEAGLYTTVLLCMEDCQAMGDGVPDACTPAACPTGPGAYCGETVGLDEGTLYQCDDGGYAPFAVCQVG